jgi:Methyltransferase domain
LNAVKFNHAESLHTKAGALAGMEQLLIEHPFNSLLDIGAGTGSWLAAARTHGVKEVLGVDGVLADEELLCVSRDLIMIHDLREPFRLGRCFDAAICLEVAEHLPELSADTLIESICAHTNFVFFSAAAPGQQGENHINCQPPSYWQGKFNACGFICSDDLRATIWTEREMEPWYRQNIFVARRDPEMAGCEPRIRHLIHPEMIQYMDFPHSPRWRRLADIEGGAAGIRHYLALLRKSVRLRLKHLIA